MEDSLLEHTDAILNLLNKATHKGNLSSGHLVQRLEYLKHRLDDFLCLKTSGLSTKPSKPGPMKQQTDDTGVLYECGICNSPITMYNGDHKLSMDLHCQEEVHQRALSKADDKPVPEVNDKHVSLVKGGTKYLCSLCNIYISKNMKCVEEHLKGQFHKKNLEAVKNELTPAEWNVHGKYFLQNKYGSLHCKLCPAKVQNDTNEITNHVRSEKHISKHVLSSKQKEPQVKDIFSALPKELKPQKSLFQSCQNGTFNCKVCGVNVPCASKTLLEHVRGNKHIKQMDAFMVVNGVRNTRCTLCSVVTTSKSNMIGHVLGISHQQKLQQAQDHVLLLIPEAYKQHRKYFMTHESDALKCILCDTYVFQNHTQVLEHICGEKHNSIHILSSVVSAYLNYVSTSK